MPLGKWWPGERPSGRWRPVGSGRARDWGRPGHTVPLGDFWDQGGPLRTRRPEFARHRQAGNRGLKEGGPENVWF